MFYSLVKVDDQGSCLSLFCKIQLVEIQYESRWCVVRGV